jgi:ABC-type antimicrobial peptide transport system permease subunit
LRTERVGEVVTYTVEWVAAPVVLGGMMLVLIGPFALIAVIIVAFAMLAALVALVGAVLALPYLLVRSVYRRLAKRWPATEANAAAQLTYSKGFSSIEGVEQ